jgi:hypothetical protein
MSKTKCKNIDDSGLCHGTYDGFGCIGDKCKDPTAGPPQDHCTYMRGDGYCKRFKKFHCDSGRCIDYVPC